MLLNMVANSNEQIMGKFPLVKLKQLLKGSVFYLYSHIDDFIRKLYNILKKPNVKIASYKRA